MDAAIQEIHERSTDPALLTEAAARYTLPDNGSGVNPQVLRLLVHAGADEAEARQVMAGRDTRGFTPPQAERGSR